MMLKGDMKGYVLLKGDMKEYMLLKGDLKGSRGLCIGDP
jgi:hypothetical protein